MGSIDNVNAAGVTPLLDGPDERLITNRPAGRGDEMQRTVLGDDSESDTGPLGPLVRKQSLGYQVNHLARLFEQQLRVRIERHGVVPGQFAQILSLYEQEPLTQRELCERVRIEQSTMAYTLQRMERGGLIERMADPADGRRAYIRLTPRARALQGELVAAARQVNSIATSGMSEAEVAALLSGVEKMIKNLEAQTVGAD